MLCVTQLLWGSWEERRSADNDNDNQIAEETGPSLTQSTGYDGDEEEAGEEPIVMVDRYGTLEIMAISGYIGLFKGLYRAL